MKYNDNVGIQKYWYENFWSNYFGMDFFFTTPQTIILAINNSEINFGGEQTNTYKLDQTEIEILKHDVIDYNKKNGTKILGNISRPKKSRNFQTINQKSNSIRNSKISDLTNLMVAFYTK